MAYKRPIPGGTPYEYVMNTSKSVGIDKSRRDKLATYT